MTARTTKTDINELVNHLKAITNELTELHGDLYWLAMQAQDGAGAGAGADAGTAEHSSAAELNVELLTSLKGAVDNMRLLLWNYIETASEVSPDKVRDGLEAQRMQRMTQFLNLLRERLGSSNETQPLSFIERISGLMKERLSNKVA
jgi:hypothetical protein